jgi:hypothetical protein
MSTLQARMPYLPKVRSPWAVLSRLAAVITTVIDVFDEALAKAHEAERRYPFTSC